MQVIKNIEDHRQMEAISIQYINSIGAIIDNCLMLHGYGRSLIDIQNIRKAEIHKTRSFAYNLVFIFCTLPLIYTLFVCRFTKLETLLISALVVSLLGFAFFIKDSKYILLIRKFDADYIELEVNKSCKEDAKNIVRVVNRKIKQSGLK